MGRTKASDTIEKTCLIGTFPSWEAMLLSQDLDVTASNPAGSVGLFSGLRITGMYSRVDSKCVKMLSCNLDSPAYYDNWGKKIFKCPWKGMALCDSDQKKPCRLPIDCNRLSDVPHELFIAPYYPHYDVDDDRPYISLIGHLHLRDSQIRRYCSHLGIPRCISDLFLTNRSSKISLKGTSLEFTVDRVGLRLEDVSNQQVALDCLLSDVHSTETKDE